MLLESLKKGNLKEIIQALSTYKSGRDPQELQNRLRFLIDCFSTSPLFDIE